jgi:HEPN domain-containing protein
MGSTSILPKFTTVKGPVSVGEYIFVRVGGLTFRTLVIGLSENKECPPVYQVVEIDQNAEPAEATSDKNVGGIFDPKQLIHAARACLLGADRCFLKIFTGFAAPNLFSIDEPQIPGVVLLALSIEISLKALINLEREENTTGHVLRALFDGVSRESQEAIRVRLGMTEAQLHEKTDAASNAFNHWRYIFEKGHSAVDVEFLKAMATACLNTAEAVLQTKR